MTLRATLVGTIAAALVLAACGGGGDGETTGTAGGSSLPSGGLPSDASTGGIGGTGPSSDGGRGTDVSGSGSGGSPIAQGAFQVNTVAAGAQNSPAIAALADGGYVMAWHVGDSQGTGIFVRRFAADGTPAGPEVRIDEPVAGRFVSVARLTGLEGGGFAVAWQSGTADADRWAVHVRHVRADGSIGPIHDEDVHGFHTYDLASLGGGGYALLLQGSTTGEPADQQLRLQRFRADDSVVDLRTVDTPLVLQNSAHAALLADGRRVLTWARNDLARGAIGLFLRFMAPDGTLDPVAHAAGAVPGALGTYLPAALRDGGFVIAGADFEPGTADPVVFVQRFAADGTAAGGRIRADDEADVAGLGTACFTPTPGGLQSCPFPWQANPAVAGTADGGFVVAWDTPDRKRPGRHVYARRFDAQGVAIGAPAPVDAAQDMEQAQPVAASVGAGFVLGWTGRDADQTGIFGRQSASAAVE